LIQSQDSAGDARGTIKAGPIRRKPWAPDRDAEDGTKTSWSCGLVSKTSAYGAHVIHK
jgi:hypothetical protein